MQYLAELFKGNADGSVNWVAIIFASIGAVLAILPLVAAVWNAFYKIPPACCGVKYRRQRPHVKRFGEHKGEVFLSWSAIRFALFGWREWKWNTMADVTTENVTVVLDLPDNTQYELKVSFTFGLIPQPQGYYKLEDIYLIRLIKAKEGGFNETLLDSLTSQLRDAIVREKLNHDSLTSDVLFRLLQFLSATELLDRGVALRRVNVCSANKTWAEKLSGNGAIRPPGAIMAV